MQPVLEITQAEQNELLAGAVKELITPVLKLSRPGHCLRISSLSEPVMRQVCDELNENGFKCRYCLYPQSPPES